MLSRIFNYENSNKFRSFLSRHGISLRLSENTRPVDFTDKPDINPIAAIYQSGGRPVLLKAPLKDCIFFSHLAFPCTPDSPSPQIQTLIEYGKGNIKSWEESPLVDFYNNFQPKNAAEMMGLESAPEQKISKYSPNAALMPWEPFSFRLKEELELKSARRDTRQYSFPREAVSGQCFGPANDLKKKLEFERLTKIYRLLKKNGLIINKEGINNIEAIILKLDTSFRFVIINGTHRIAAWTALNNNTVDLQIKYFGIGGIVDFDESAHWPPVVKNNLTKKQSELIFKRIFNAVQPEIYKNS